MYLQMCSPGEVLQVGPLVTPPGAAPVPLLWSRSGAGHNAWNRKGKTQTSCTATEIPSQPYGPLIIPNKHYRRAIQWAGAPWSPTAAN